MYTSFLHFPSLVTGVIAHFVVSLTTLRNANITGHYIGPAMGIIVMSIVLPLLINMWYQPELALLMRLEHQWMLRLRAVAGSAVPIHSEASSTLETGSGSSRSENKTEDNIYRKIFHRASYVESMRYWHAWKLSAVILFLVNVLAWSGIALLMISAAHAVIHHRGVTVGQYATLVYSVSGIIMLGIEMGSFFTNMQGNHTMLKQITCIMNDEDIGFDGGTDPFGSAHIAMLKKMKRGHHGHHNKKHLHHRVHFHNKHHHQRHDVEPGLTHSISDETTQYIARSAHL